jgi:hypothetical protein
MAVTRTFIYRRPDTSIDWYIADDTDKILHEYETSEKITSKNISGADGLEITHSIVFSSEDDFQAFIAEDKILDHVSKRDSYNSSVGITGPLEF